MTTSALLPPSECRRALMIINPSVLDAMRRGPLTREAGLLLVLNPTVLFNPKFDGDPSNQAFLDELILYAHFYGDQSTWEHPFAHVAVAKAWASFKYSLPASVIQQRHPYLWSKNMTKWGGSAIDPDGGLIVAFSGVQAHFDEMISKWMLATLIALSVNGVSEIMGAKSAFIEGYDEGMGSSSRLVQGQLASEKERKLLLPGD